jgi:polyhydroxyalkanoate synthesis repressor PhaR
MPQIKRYPNRKLYDTEAKKYITLDGIAELIRNGEDVQVIDHTTEEDLTAVTLTQIIFEQEKKKSGFLPTSVLTGLVQAGGDTLNNLRRTLTSPLDLLNHVDTEIDKRLRSLVERGELAKEEAGKLRAKLLSDPVRISAENNDAAIAGIEEIVRKRGIPTKDEVNALIDQLDDLTQKIDTLSAESKVEQGSSA